MPDDALDQELGSGKVGSLRSCLVVPGADQQVLRRRAVDADDVVDEGVLENSQVSQRENEAAGVVISVLQERRVYLHLPQEHRPQPRLDLFKRRNLLWPLRELALGRNTPN